MVENYDLSLDHRPSVEEILDSFRNPQQYREVVFSGFGEPTLRMNVLLAVAKSIKQQGGKVRVDTDGLADLVHKESVLPEMATCVDVLSVSMNAQDAENYDRICQPGLPGSYPAMLTFLSKASDYIKDVRATVVKGIEGIDINECRRIAKQVNAAFTARTLDVIE